MKTYKEWLHENTQQKKKLFVLVGPPSIGKSTWIKNTFPFFTKPYIINRDQIVDDIADSLGLTYDDMFMYPPPNAQLGDFHPRYGEIIQSPSHMQRQPLSYSKILTGNFQINSLLKNKISQATKQNKDIIVDMTNMTAHNRKNALQAIQGKENEYEKIAVIFPFQGAEEHIKQVAKKRADEIKSKGGSKNIPDHAFDDMFSKFQDVQPDEGFDRIMTQDNRELIKQLAKE